MKNIKIIIPAIVAVLFIFFLYTNISRTAEINKIESQLTELRLLSHDLKESFSENLRALKNLDVVQDNDLIVLANKNYAKNMDNYLVTLKDLEYDRLYSLYKVLHAKNTILDNVFEDLKTDYSTLKDSTIWAKNAYKDYMENTRTLTPSDRSYLKHLFDVTIGSSNKTARDFQYISALEHTDLLNANLKMIYNQRVKIVDSLTQLQKNDISYEVNEVIKYTYDLSKELRKESESIVSRLLYISLVLLLLAIGIYVKELKDAKELEKTRNELKEFFDALNVSAIVSKSDLNGKITYVNDRFCEISGYSRDELMGKPHSIVRHPSTDAKIFKELWDTIQANKIFKGVIKNKKKDGGVYIVDTTVIPIHNEEGKIVEYLSVRHDLTHTIHMVL